MLNNIWRSERERERKRERRKKLCIFRMQSVEMLSMALAQTDNLYAQVLELWKMYSRKWAALSIELALIRVLSNREQSSCGSIDEADRIRGTEGTSRNFI